MHEDIQKAIHDLEFTSDSLRQALHKANPVEAIVIIDLIGKVANLTNETKNFMRAIK